VGYFRILAAIPGFFISALVLMLLWNVIALQLGLASVSYVTAMLLNITLWLAVAPLVAAGRFHCFGIFALVPGFFLSSVFVMLLWDANSSRLGLDRIDYSMAMLVTITSWLAVGPLAFVSVRATGWRWTWQTPRR